MFKFQFETVANKNGWDDDEKALELFLALKGAAAEILATIPDSRRNKYNENHPLVNNIKTKAFVNGIRVNLNASIVERVVISKETVRHHGKDQGPPHHQRIRIGRTTNHLCKNPR